MNGLEIGGPAAAVKRPAEKTKADPHFPRARYYALMLVSGGGQYVYGLSPDGAARAIWRRNTPSMFNFDDGDIERNQRTAEQIINGDAGWYRHADGSYWFDGNN